MDFVDIAGKEEERFRAESLKRALRPQASSEDWDALSAKWCNDARCGQRIPDARRKAIPGVQRCVECQAEQERRSAR
jgi:phage/conjugal plasmid C-4 type zinc finger TraR family protein